MDNLTRSAGSVFLVSGLSDIPEVQTSLSAVFLFINIISLVGDILLILVYMRSPRLNTSMFFCLTNLSFLEICYISSTVPKMLVDSLSEQKTITFYGCAIHIQFSGTGRHRLLYVGGNGLRWIQRHMPSPFLLHHYEKEGLYGSCCRVRDHWGH